MNYQSATNDPTTRGTLLAKTDRDSRTSSAVRCGDVSLFYAWLEGPSGQSMTVPPSWKRTSLTSQSGTNGRYSIAQESLILTSWNARRLAALPDLTKGLQKFTLAELGDVIIGLFSAAYRMAPMDVPLYFVLHIGTVELSQSSSGKTPSDVSSRSRGHLANRVPLAGDAYRALISTIDAARTQVGLGTYTSHASASPGAAASGAIFFEHYSTLAQRRGYLILDPRCSALINTAEQDVRLLLSLAQQAPITPNGLDPVRYETVLARVSQWDANADTQASLDNLMRMNESNQASTLGQVLLSIALAVVSGLMALIQISSIALPQFFYPLLLYSVAALCSALYAVRQRRVWLVAAVMGVAFGTLLIIGLLLMPALKTFLPVP